ncbi:hypothetical protein [Acinetobacter bereziniae]|uniref:hypothetical protein n=1 Tax=Acinetobacter bereziniae TaxID=106648 RepID=UPI00073EB9A3|nr:hypothetical protein [Acinetobacter bereziniae]RSZ23199.1 hypothetical protein NDM229_022350 [Acinetobacter bereziniae]
MYMVYQWDFIDRYHAFFSTMNMVMNTFTRNSGRLLDFLMSDPSSFKNLEKDRLTFRLYRPLVEIVKVEANAKNMSVNHYLELAVIEKLKMDALTEKVDDDVDDYSLLENKSQDQLAYLKRLLNQTLQDNQRLKQVVDKYRSTEHGNEFDSFELF